MATTIDVKPEAPNVVNLEPNEPIANSVFSGSIGGTGEILILPIGENIILGTAVANVNGVAYKYNINNPAHAYALAGIAQTSAVMGQFVVVQPDGLVNVPGWNLTPGAVYHVGSNGALTSSPDLSTGRILQTLGKAINSSTLLLRPDDPVTL
ncbi:hypothetical protein [Spirosoma aerolatum]|uniref:hypothetical protein n=1 Tax=Spirosoma aerolatum TaxID=1211326 RepID=UPI0009AEDE4E|nr:hypothetical protein [Spirosoma aerolatum]